MIGNIVCLFYGNQDPIEKYCIESEGPLKKESPQEIKDFKRQEIINDVGTDNLMSKGKRH